ncbi:hypothetical protein D3C71_1988090 [compost metagenome]
MAQRAQGIRAQVKPAAADGAHRLHQFVGAAAFGEITTGPGINRALHEGIGVIDAENDGAKGGTLLA